MKVICLLITLSFVMPWNSFALEMNRSTCNKYIEAQERNLMDVKERFNVGEVVLSDIKVAELELLQAKFDCRSISFDDFCKESLAAWGVVIEGLRQEFAIGTRTFQDVDNAELKALEMQSVCE